jgi:fatty acid desaturase
MVSAHDRLDVLPVASLTLLASRFALTRVSRVLATVALRAVAIALLLIALTLLVLLVLLPLLALAGLAALTLLPVLILVLLIVSHGHSFRLLGLSEDRRHVADERTNEVRVCSSCMTRLSRR